MWRYGFLKFMFKINKYVFSYVFIVISYVFEAKYWIFGTFAGDIRLS